MFLTILLVSSFVGFAGTLILLIGQIRHNARITKENIMYWTQIRNQDQEIRDLAGDVTLAQAERDSRIAEVKRLTNKLIEIQNHANLIEEDAAARIEDFKKQPMIACMNDGQVAVLAEMLVSYIRQLLELKKEYIN